ncbi:ferritin-like domain-containing protein [Fibrella aquatilis]|uniref:Ferritin-like domain-containing protein n=1 Tax=Fibrella aquatilis TaxID=2817059 RepID=A0A939G8W6_9BACT|nr:ferritin-like domain-containing protein [Fibrella aquatilis]MBO0934369.1 ferritin-like domain-containing protein [Fibrella aquatilis]
MNLQNILNELEVVDGELAGRMAHVSRRGLFSSLTRKTIAAAAPMVMASALTSAYGQGSGLPSNVVDVLNFALLLEYAESDFYNRGATSGLMVPMENREMFAQIRKHENAHVRLLRSVLGSQAIAMPRFDFTAGGAFPDVFSNFQTYAAVSQAFEDTGVRAYKGQAANLRNAPAILEVALNIHSVEARHAARIRQLRGQKGWITDNMASGLPQAIYDGENITHQLGIEVIGLTGKSRAEVTEAFDEILSKDQTLAIAGAFLAK